MFPFHMFPGERVAYTTFKPSSFTSPYFPVVMRNVSIASQWPAVGSDQKRHGHPGSQLHEFIHSPFALHFSAIEETPQEEIANVCIWQFRRSWIQSAHVRNLLLG